MPDDVEKLGSPEGIPPLFSEILKHARGHVGKEDEEDEEDAGEPRWLREPGEVPLDETIRRCIILWNKGYTVVTLAKAFKRHKNTIYRWVREARGERDQLIVGETKIALALDRLAQLEERIQELTEDIDRIQPDGTVRCLVEGKEEKIRIGGSNDAPVKALERRQKLQETRRRTELDYLNLLCKLGYITDEEAKMLAVVGGEKAKDEKRRKARRSQEELDREAEELRRQIEGLDDEQESEAGDG